VVTNNNHMLLTSMSVPCPQGDKAVSIATAHKRRCLVCEHVTKSGLCHCQRPLSLSATAVCRHSKHEWTEQTNRTHTKQVCCAIFSDLHETLILSSLTVDTHRRKSLSVAQKFGWLRLDIFIAFCSAIVFSTVLYAMPGYLPDSDADLLQAVINKKHSSWGISWSPAVQQIKH